MSTRKHNSSFLQQLGITSLKNKLSKKEIKHYLHLGGQNYANLKEKVPILDANGKQLRFTVGGKTVLEMLKPIYKDGYTPVPGTEHIFVKPSFKGTYGSISKSAKLGTSGSNKTKKQNGGNAIAILPIIGAVLYMLIQAGNSGSFAAPQAVKPEISPSQPVEPSVPPMQTQPADSNVI